MCAAVGLLAHGFSGHPEAFRNNDVRLPDRVISASSGMEDAVFSFTVARAAPVSHRVPVSPQHPEHTPWICQRIGLLTRIRSTDWGSDGQRPGPVVRVRYRGSS